MGYFSNGLVLTAPPDFDAIGRALPDRLIRGYKHFDHELWLLDLWYTRGRLQLRRGPFADALMVANFRIDLAHSDPATHTFLTALEQLTGTLKRYGRGECSEMAYLHLALAVATATRAPVFVFAADDEDLDLGANVLPNTVVSAGCRFCDLAIRHVNGSTTVTPLTYDEDEPPEAPAVLPTVPGIIITEPEEVVGGMRHYENPVTFWPSHAGDPMQMLGLGTWDQLENVARDYQVVFEKLA